ncbi:hypothetical protein [Sutcliffiella horikoshii]|uniref:hypothetical protein n=1 Tax=Sutcliffiella horikoshii TaxID=79883 RepID=UPI0007D0B936|nr:hypothetical protein [Sutcliffiella horikoshii]
MFQVFQPSLYKNAGGERANSAVFPTFMIVNIVTQEMASAKAYKGGEARLVFGATPLLISVNGFAFRGATLSLLGFRLRDLKIVATPPQESTPFSPITS